MWSIIDKKNGYNQKKRAIKPSRRIREFERKRDFYYNAINDIFNSHKYVVVEDLNLKRVKRNTGYKQVYGAKGYIDTCNTCI